MSKSITGTLEIERNDDNLEMKFAFKMSNDNKKAGLRLKRDPLPWDVNYQKSPIVIFPDVESDKLRIAEEQPAVPVQYVDCLTFCQGMLALSLWIYEKYLEDENNKSIPNDKLINLLPDLLKE